MTRQSFGIQPKTSGLAIANLVCGLLICLAPFSTVLAIVFGAIGISQTSNQKARGRGLAITGLVLGAAHVLLLIPMMVAILLPALNSARERANRVKCATNMQQLGMAIMIHANDKGAMPADINQLAKSAGLDPRIYTCPSSSDTVGQCSYVYVPRKMSDGADAVMLYESLGNHGNKGMNVLFADGHVEWLTADAARQLLARQQVKP